MSTDLKFHLPPLQIQTPRPISHRSTTAGEQDPRLDGSDAASPTENGPESHDNEAELCRTPRSAEHRIPEIRSPPPAPRKKRRIPVCKRKLMPEFVEIVNGDEVDEFFRSGFELVSSLAKRSKCVSTLFEFRNSDRSRLL